MTMIPPRAIDSHDSGTTWQSYSNTLRNRPHGAMDQQSVDLNTQMTRKMKEHGLRLKDLMIEIREHHNTFDEQELDRLKKNIQDTLIILIKCIPYKSNDGHTAGNADARKSVHDVYSQVLESINTEADINTEAIENASFDAEALENLLRLVAGKMESTVGLICRNAFVQGIMANESKIIPLYEETRQMYRLNKIRMVREQQIACNRPRFADVFSKVNQREAKGFRKTAGGGNPLVSSNSCGDCNLEDTFRRTEHSHMLKNTVSKSRSDEAITQQTTAETQLSTYSIVPSEINGHNLVQRSERQNKASTRTNQIRGHSKGIASLHRPMMCLATMVICWWVGAAIAPTVRHNICSAYQNDYFHSIPPIDRWLTQNVCGPKQGPQWLRVVSTMIQSCYQLVNLVSTGLKSIFTL